jgi:hypothetical protein
MKLNDGFNLLVFARFTLLEVQYFHVFYDDHMILVLVATVRQEGQRHTFQDLVYLCYIAPTKLS